jgi:glucose/arabinose dehydrogenase
MMPTWSSVRRAAGVLVVALFAGSRAAQAQPAIALVPVVSGLSNPVTVTNARDGSRRLFIVEQAGTIRIYDGTQILPTPFLNITTRVLSGGEQGLLGLAFDANYPTNGLFYVYYTSQPAGDITIARYRVTADPNVADTQSEVILKTQPHPTFTNHNGGSLLFGPDGCLYAGIGDGGGGGDPNNNGQNLGTLLAKIIRISPGDGTPCPAAPGNPFVGTPGARGEIWALGVRNPWRITFDRATGDLLIADVGQGAREEVDVQPAGTPGRNYCWKNMEGTLVFDASVPCTAGTPTLPVLDYPHTLGNCSITGGYRYRGSQFPALTGVYFYADFCTGRIWGATQNGTAWTTTELLNTGLNISTFGEDEAGEIYVAALTTGTLLRLVVDKALQVSPAAAMTLTGPQGGPFSPPSVSYALSAASGSAGYAISLQFGPGVASWLSASSTSGTVTSAATSVAFTANSAAASLAPGRYSATIAFANTTNGQGNTTRTVTLLVNRAGCTLASQFGDFNGDGKDDLLFRLPSSGLIAEYLMNGVQIVSAQAVGIVDPVFALVALGDFNGDGKADLLFRRGDGFLSVFFMNGAQVLNALPIGLVGPQWGIVGIADFNGDGKTDILFRRESDGMLSLFLMNGAQVAAAQFLGALAPEWRVRGVRDVNGDGRADILFRRSSDGMLALYLLNGFQVTDARLIGAVAPEFEVIGLRDFNGDNKADLLFRRAGDGFLAVYLMNGFQVLAAQTIGTVDPVFTVLGLGDLDGDGRADIVFRRNGDGMVSAFLMSGAQVVAAQFLGPVGTDPAACFGQPPLAAGGAAVSSRAR